MADEIDEIVVMRLEAILEVITQVRDMLEFQLPNAAEDMKKKQKTRRVR